MYVRCSVGSITYITGTSYSDQLKDQALLHCFPCGEEGIYKATEEKTEDTDPP